MVAVGNNIVGAYMEDNILIVEVFGLIEDLFDYYNSLNSY
jgi:hypothetical protein